ncbi:pseudouridylate synthase 7 homolog [Bactrocera neohumeralis]|uniref:pseudouridylate synthase 7 homolog n=1 Tax=Bactrocera neohumeralis TaxID=98809 RepID=UPI002166A4DA|nr:pseudouridylate synthase 7 homolog [Bactrocera neohumeralis]
MPQRKKAKTPWRPKQMQTKHRQGPEEEWRKRLPKKDGSNKNSLREDQVGITEYVSKGAGFTGVVKSRFSDFHVNEIDLDGKVLQLNDLTVPKPAEPTLDEEELAAVRQKFREIITDDTWDKMSALAALGAKDPAAQPIDIIVTALDKTERGQIHDMLKTLYSSKLVGSTVTEVKDSTEERIIRVMKPKYNSSSEKRTRWNFPGEYVHFLVYKENMETSEAASRLASRIGMHPSNVNYCGTKDKRAKTTQKFCIKRRLPSQILTAAQKSYVRIGNFTFSNDVLKLGDLKGNRFRIALRHVNGDEAEIQKALESLRDKGFINYFGLQRFGNHADIPTYEIGVALLKADYKTVAELILKPRSNDLPFMDEVRKKWWEERNSAAAAAMFIPNEFIEKKLLDGLAKYGENDYAAALRKIPRNMLLLYPHSFQSFVFNRIASRRIKEHGFKLIPGDLVYRNKEEMDEDIIEKCDLDNPTDNVAEDIENNEDNLEAKEDAETPASDAKNEDSIFKRKVKALTEEDIVSGNYTLFDVVLPLPGHDITYPSNEVGAWYEEILAEYGLSSEKLRHKVKTFAMAGAYRKLLICPRELTWKFRKYSTPEETLIASDWDRIAGKADKIENTEGTGDLKALLLDFCLPPSVYATMFLRELLKSDTSAAQQLKIEKDEMSKVRDKMQTPEVNESKDDAAQVESASEVTTTEKRKLTEDEAVEVEEKKLKTS